MSHKPCCFLIDAAQLVAADPELDPVTSPDAMFIRSVDLVFQPYFNECLRNNRNYWHKHEALLMRDGRVVQLVEDGDWLGRDDEAHRWRDDEDACVAYMSEEPGPWMEKIMLNALRCAADACFDILDEINGVTRSSLSGMTANAIMLWLYHDLPAFISDLFTAAREQSGYDSSSCRLRLVRIYETFRMSRFAPFSTVFQKADIYRCFDLREDTSTEPDPRSISVLLTDIVTP